MEIKGKELFYKIVDFNKEYDSKIDNILIAISSPLLIGYFALITISNPLNIEVRIFLLISFVLNIFGLLLLIWYGVRYKTRYTDWKELIKVCSERNYKQYKLLMEKLVLPNTLYKFVGELTKVLETEKPKTKDEFSEIMLREQETYLSQSVENDKDVNAALTYLLNKSLMTDALFVDEKVFKKPRNEKNAKIKFFLDMLSWKTRYLFFASGITTIIIAVILHILSL